MLMPAPFDGYVEKPARVSSTCLVSVARNRYSVPCELFGQMVSTPLYPASVVVVAEDRIVARHDRLSNAGDTRYDWQHYIPLLQRKPGALRNGAPFADMPEPLQRLRNASGDRVMAPVLAIVLTAGLDAVLVAVESALETGPPGKVSVEHVVNVLGRLNAAPAPQTAARGNSLRATPCASSPARSTQHRGGSKQRNELHFSTADGLGVGFHPWLNIRSARWLRFRSAPTIVTCIVALIAVLILGSMFGSF